MSRWGRSFFGLPGPEDEGFLDGIRAFKMAQLSELRLVCQEVGTLSDARSMPTEIRKWWCGKILEKDSPQGGTTTTEQNGKRFVTKDVK
jgi:hypothetical protein